MKKASVVLWLIICILSFGLTALAQDQQPKLADLNMKYYSWRNPGTNPYIKGGAKTLRELSEKIKSMPSFVYDLVQIGLRENEARYAYAELTDPSSDQIEEVVLQRGKIIQNMMFGSGLEKNVIVDHDKGAAWKLEIKIEGNPSGVILYVPKVCINICLDVFSIAVRKNEVIAQPTPIEKPTFKVVEKAEQVEKPVFKPVEKVYEIEKPVYKTREKQIAIPLPIDSKKKTHWYKSGWFWGPVIGGTTAGTILLFRHYCREKVIIIDPTKTWIPGKSPTVGFQVSFSFDK